MAIPESTLLALALVLLAGSPAPAAECRGVALPEAVAVDGKPLVLNGVGVREVTLFGIDVYVAGLYLERRSEDAAAILAGSAGPRRLVLRFVRSVDRGQVVESLARGVREAARADTLVEEWLARLARWIPDLEAGDALAFTDRPLGGLRVEVRGRMRGTLGDAELARAFFGNWLGSRPPTPALKTGLLGGPCD